MLKNKVYHTNKGVAMGSPVSNTIAEIFIEHHENNYIKHILDAKIIKYYTRYVDVILIYTTTTELHTSPSRNKSSAQRH